MAIQGSFNLHNALDSQSYAYKCWYNYNYGNNTMGISSKDMSEITQTWSGELSNWKATATDDENAYEIEDDDFSRAVDKGKDNAKDATGYDGGGKFGMGARASVDAVAGGAGAMAMYTGIGTKVANQLGNKIGGKLISNSYEKIVGKAGQEAAKKATEKALEEGATKEVAKAAGQKAGKEAATESAKKSAQNVGSWSIAAPLAFAVGTIYQAKKPNKDQKEACDDLQDEMRNAQNATMAAQEDMAVMGDELIELSDEAAMYNDEANENIEEQKSEFDVYKASYEELMAKVEAGEALTEDEKALLQELIPVMQELGVSMEEMTDETTDVVGEIFDEMDTYQDGYDNAAETVAEVQGLTDFAESFDEATRTMCYVESAAQGLNAASGGQAALKAGAAAAGSLGFNAWAWACAAMGAAGAAMSGLGAVQQFKWAGEVGNEIGEREVAQEFNTATSDIYDESIGDYEGYMSNVEDLELEIPDDMEAPEEVPEIPEGDGKEGAPQASGFGIAANDDDKEKPEKDKQ